MHVGEDGHVAGSVNRAQVAELLAATDDEELKAYYRDLLGESEEGTEYDQSPPASAEDEPVTITEAPAIDDDLDALRVRAEELGVKVDGRWGEQRLRDEIAAAERGD